MSFLLAPRGCSDVRDIMEEEDMIHLVDGEGICDPKLIFNSYLSRFTECTYFF